MSADTQSQPSNQLSFPKDKISSRHWASSLPEPDEHSDHHRQLTSLNTINIRKDGAQCKRILNISYISLFDINNSPKNLLTTNTNEYEALSCLGYHLWEVFINNWSSKNILLPWIRCFTFVTWLHIWPVHFSIWLTIKTPFYMSIEQRGDTEIIKLHNNWGRKRAPFGESHHLNLGTTNQCGLGKQNKCLFIRRLRAPAHESN